MKKKLWVITGGHHNSALVVAQELKKMKENVVWYGHRRSAEDDHGDSAEYKEVSRENIVFRTLKAGKFSRFNPLSLLKIPYGIVQAIYFLTKDKPLAVVSFGGYLGFATGIAAIILRIPLFIHEQTVVSGKANLFLSLFAKRTYLTWASSISFFPKTASLKVIGLPLRPKLLSSNLESKKLFHNNKPILLFLCGKQGSHKINEYIFGNIISLLSRYNIIHQTGSHTKYQDYQKATQIKSVLDNNLKDDYYPFEYAKEDELAKFLNISDLVIGRSGAHITYELAVKGKKAILIPYLFTYKQEQLQNARFLVRNGLGTILFEDELTFATLRGKIEEMLKSKNTKAIDLPIASGSIMIQDMLRILKR